MPLCMESCVATGYSVRGVFINPSVSVSALMRLIDFTLSNARRFFLSMGNPSDTEGLNCTEWKKSQLLV